MAEVRRRKNDAQSQHDDDKRVVEQPVTEASSPRISLTDILRMLGGVLLVNCALSYYITGSSLAWGYRPWYTQPAQVKSWLSGTVRLTDEQLLAHDGSDASKPLYVALNGSIYDVSANRRTYGPGGTYSFFAGRDATRSFVTGCFDSDLVPDLRGVEQMYIPLDDEQEDAKLSRGELKTRRERDQRLARNKMEDVIEGWVKMFDGRAGKPYFKVGEVIREPGWLDKMPERPLCDRAKNLRKKRKPDA